MGLGPKDEYVEEAELRASTEKQELDSVFQDLKAWHNKFSKCVIQPNSSLQLIIEISGILQN